MLRGLKSQRQFTRGIKTIHKELKFGNEARLAVLRGATTLHDAVAVSLGPKGRNALMEQKYNAPRITKDGVSIAEEIVVADKFENMGAQLFKDITQKANAESGDGTTSSTVLAHAILSDAIKKVSTGSDANSIRKGVQAGVQRVVDYLESQKKTITGGEELKQIAAISCNGDAHLGDLIAKAVEAVGLEGIITIEKGNTVEDKLEVKKGFRFNEGFIDAKFGDLRNPKKKIELENPLILLHKGDIKQAQHILPILSHAQREKRPVLVICENLGGDALAISILNKIRGQVNIVAVRAPGFGDARTDYFSDLEAVTGATLTDPNAGTIASTATKHLFGSASSVSISSTETVIVGGNGPQQAVELRVEEIRARLENDKTLGLGDKDQMKERLAKLTSGAAVVQVGGASQMEVKEKKDRLDDALNSTYSALKNGIVPGGGVALLKSSVALEGAETDLNFDEMLGLDIVKKSLSAPFDRILANSGLTGADYKRKLDGSFSTGVDATTGEVVDMYDAGVIDPLNTVKSALTNAAGVTSLLATTEVAITNVLGKIEGFDGR